MDILKKCNLCPRNCNINRYLIKGACGADYKLKVAHYSLHMWEEPIVSGENGSGTVFFSNCNLKCIFRQNHIISSEGLGKETSKERLADIFLTLQNKNAHNIDLVTPTHYVPQIIDSIKIAKNNGLKIPIVYNTSSYENIETIKMLNGYIDVYLADLKYYDNTLSEKYSKCIDYFKYASKAIDQMYNQVGKPVIVNNLIKKGLIIRVLVLPGHVDDAKKIISYIYNKYGDNVFISIMNQYTPIFKFRKYPNLNHKLSNSEYDEIIDYAINLGVSNAFIQDGETQRESFIPNFNPDIV